MNITETLKGDFVIMDLGSSFAKDNKVLSQFSPAITSIELDALSTGNVSSDRFYKSVKLKKGIHPVSGKHVFYERRFIQCSSFLKVQPGISGMYGLEKFVEQVAEIEMDCITLPELLQNENIPKVDFLKTDLEGLDTSILKSAEPFLTDTLVIKSELRFQPFYETEPFFFDTCAYLHQQGFEIVSIVPEYWKYNTKNTSLYRDGRIVFGDFIFFKKIKNDHPEFPKQVLKQILLAKSLHLNSHAEYLFEQHKDILPTQVVKELEKLTNVKWLAPLGLARFFNIMSKLPGYSVLKRGIKALYMFSATDQKKYPHVAGK